MQIFHSLVAALGHNRNFIKLMRGDQILCTIRYLRSEDIISLTIHFNILYSTIVFANIKNIQAIYPFTRRHKKEEETRAW